MIVKLDITVGIINIISGSYEIFFESVSVLYQ